MPNWCECVLIVGGDKEEIASFYARVTRNDGDEKRVSLQETFMPIPEVLKSIHMGGATAPDGRHVRLWRDGEPNEDGVKAVVPVEDDEQAELLEKYGAGNWYDWMCENWGAKWGDCDTQLDVLSDEDGKRLRFTFQSPWCPPMEGIDEIARGNPELTFKLAWWEGGAGQQGRAKWRRGERVENDVYPYSELWVTDELEEMDDDEEE